MKVRDYSRDWEELFYLDSESPSGLRWKHKSKHHEKDSVVGCAIHRKGIKAGWVVKINSENYYIHAIIYTMLHGCLEQGFVVDHLDGNNHNNSTDNLKSKTRRHNTQNRCLHPKNNSGVPGVTLATRYNRKKPPNTYWCASWRSVEGLACNKFFSVNKYGNEKAFSLAVSCRINELEKLNSQGMDYTERHIKG